MIKGQLAMANGEEILMLGITHEEIAHLVMGDPMVLDFEDCQMTAPPPRLVLMAGADTDDLVAQMERKIGRKADQVITMEHP